MLGCWVGLILSDVLGYSRGFSRCCPVCSTHDSTQRGLLITNFIACTEFLLIKMILELIKYGHGNGHLVLQLHFISSYSDDDFYIVLARN